jgi:hypothetical protein
VTLVADFLNLGRGPADNLNKLVAKEDGRVPKSAEHKVNYRCHEHGRVFDFHLVFSLVGG